MLRRRSDARRTDCGGDRRARRSGGAAASKGTATTRSSARSTTSSSSTRRTTASTTFTAAGRAFAASPTPTPRTRRSSARPAEHVRAVPVPGPERREPAGELGSEPLVSVDATCDNTTGGTFPSHFTNAPFSIDDYIKPDDITCRRRCSRSASRTGSAGRHQPGHRPACSRRPPRRLYARHRAPLQRRAVPAQRRAAEPLRAPQRRRRARDGHLRHQSCRSTSTCTSRATRYAILDNFFQAAFGGSYLNHQWLIAAASPVCNAANGCPANATHSVLDANGFPSFVSPPARTSRRERARSTSRRDRPGQRRADAGRAVCRRRTPARLRRLRREHDAAVFQPSGSSAPSSRRRRARRSATG